MLFGVKIGNSTLSIAKFSSPIERDFELIFNSSIEGLRIESLKKLLLGEEDVVVCSVVPSLTEEFVRVFKDSFKHILIIDHKLRTDLSFLIENPEKFGADRLTCSVAAHELFGGDIALVDAGTATTITIVTEKGEIHGGAILPGLQTMNTSLNKNTALLPLISLDEPISLPGKNTDTAIRVGIVLGTCYAIEGIIKEIENTMNTSLKVILTGGNVGLITKYLKIPHKVEPYLVFEGMRLIYLKNIKFI